MIDRYLLLNNFRRRLGFVSHSGIEYKELQKIFEKLTNYISDDDGFLYYNPKLVADREEFRSGIRGFVKVGDKIHPAISLDFRDVVFADSYLIRILEKTLDMLHCGETLFDFIFFQIGFVENAEDLILNVALNVAKKEKAHYSEMKPHKKVIEQIEKFEYAVTSIS